MNRYVNARYFTARCLWMLLLLSFGEAQALTAIKAEECASWAHFIHVSDPALNTAGTQYHYDLTGEMKVIARYLRYAPNMYPNDQERHRYPYNPFYAPENNSSATARDVPFARFTGMESTVRTAQADLNPHLSSGVQIDCEQGHARVGSFINSYASNLPRDGIKGGGPHTLWGYAFHPYEKIIGQLYDQQDDSSYIALQAFTRVVDYLPSQNAHPVCQLSFLLELNHVLTGRYIPILFNIFDPRPAKDGVFIGNDGNRFYSFALRSGAAYPKNSQYFTVHWGGHHSQPWEAMEFQRVGISKTQMLNILKIAGEGSAPNLYHYQISGFHLLHEIPNATAAAGASCGVQMRDLGMYVLP